MLVISSQHYRNEERIEEKKLEIAGLEKVTLPVHEVGFDDLYILADGHHIRESAIELSIPVEYEIVEHGEHLTGEALLEQSWNDGDYYYIETGKLVW